MAQSKKKAADEVKEKIILGRPGNNVKMGIVGMPNVGKSTLFNLMSKQNVAAENYPFCTIDPNVARVLVPDPRFNFLCEHHHPASEVPAYLTVTDIAGLVKGASEGKGLGNAFLSHIGMVDAIYHLVRAFDDDTVEHVEGSIDPIRDLDIISEELRKKDEAALTAALDNVQRIVDRNVDKTKKFDLDTLLKVKDIFEAKKDVRDAEWTQKEVEVLNPYNFLSAKPVIYLVNISQADYMRQKNKWLAKIAQWVAQNSTGAPVIPFSCAFEAKISEMKDEDRATFLEEHKPLKSMLTKIVHTGYAALNLIHYFTAGSDEVKCWTVRNTAKAPQAAGVIHTDFERGFIAAEVMAFDDFKELGSEQAVKAAGKYRTQGKDYVVQDGDICFFKFNVSKSSAKKH